MSTTQIRDWEGTPLQEVDLEALKRWAIDYLHSAQRELPAFDEFVEGYGDTTAVELTLGVVSSDVGAGQLYFLVPVSLIASLSDGSTQTFAGCYTLHLARPQLQAVPPFRPMSIQHANIVQAGDEAEPSAAYCQ